MPDSPSRGISATVSRHHRPHDGSRPALCAASPLSSLASDPRSDAGPAREIGAGDLPPPTRLRLRGCIPRTMSHRDGQLADLRPLSGAKSRQRVSCPFGSRVRICLNCPSRSLLWETLDEALGRQQLLVSLPDPRVDVGRGAAPVGDRLDRPEVVLAGGTGQEAAVSLEVRVEFLLALRCCLR